MRCFFSLFFFSFSVSALNYITTIIQVNRSDSSTSQVYELIWTDPEDFTVWAQFISPVGESVCTFYLHDNVPTGRDLSWYSGTTVRVFSGSFDQTVSGYQGTLVFNDSRSFCDPSGDIDQDGFSNEFEDFLGTDKTLSSVSGFDLRGLKIENPYPFQCQYQILVEYPDGETYLQSGVIDERELFGDSSGIELPNYGNLPDGAKISVKLIGGGIEETYYPSGSLSDSVGWEFDNNSISPSPAPVVVSVRNPSGSAVSPSSGAGSVSDSWNSSVLPPPDVSTPSDQLLDASAVARGMQMAKGDISDAVKSGVSGIESRQDQTNNLLSGISDSLSGGESLGVPSDVVDIPIDGFSFDSEEVSAADFSGVADGAGETPENISVSQTEATTFFSSFLTLVDIPAIGQDPTLNLPSFTIGRRSISSFSISCDYPITPIVRAASFAFFAILMFWPFVVATRYAWG